MILIQKSLASIVPRGLLTKMVQLLVVQKDKLDLNGIRLLKVREILLDMNKKCLLMLPRHVDLQ